MPLIGVLFELANAETLPGDFVCVLGGRAELGGWGVRPGVTPQLGTNAFMYPRWTALRPVWLEYDANGGELTIEYKYAVARGAAATSLKWEGLAGNRSVRVPLVPSQLYLIMDSRFGEPSAPTFMRTTMPEVRARWASFVPDWVTLPQHSAKLGLDLFVSAPRLPLQADREAVVDAPAEHQAGALPVKPEISTASTMSPSWPDDSEDDDDEDDDESDSGASAGDGEVVPTAERTRARRWKRDYDVLFARNQELEEENRRLRERVQELMSGLHLGQACLTGNPFVFRSPRLPPPASSSPRTPAETPRMSPRPPPMPLPAAATPGELAQVLERRRRSVEGPAVRVLGDAPSPSRTTLLGRGRSGKAALCEAA